MWQVNETFAQHHRDKVATLHVVPEYEESEDVPLSSGRSSDVGASTSTDPLPIPRARQAFVPRSTGDLRDGGGSGAGGLPGQLPSPSTSINPAAHYASARWSALRPIPAPTCCIDYSLPPALLPCILTNLYLLL